MEPDTPEARIYNSFLAFEQDSNSFVDFFCSIEYQEIYEYFLEEKGIKLSRTPDPVDLLTGSFSWEYTDFSLYGKNDLPFTRCYESSDAAQNHGLGYGWSTNYTYELRVDTLFAQMIFPGGKRIQFNVTYDGSAQYEPAGDYTLSWDGSYYRVLNTKTSTLYTFDEAGLIQSIDYLDGNQVTYAYDGNLISQVSNDTGSFQFSYNADGNLEQVTDSVGRSITLSYDGDYLISVQNPDGDSLQYTYTPDGFVETVQNFKARSWAE